MREVVIVGVGQTPVDEHWEISLRDLAALHARVWLEACPFCTLLDQCPCQCCYVSRSPNGQCDSD